MLFISKTNNNFSILLITYGTRISPATRYRVHQYLPYFEEKSISYRVYSILSHKTTSLMIDSVNFNKFKRFIYYFIVLSERIFKSWKLFFLARKFDIVFLQRVTFPFGLEKILWLFNKNIIFDIDDSIYLPDREEKGIAGSLKKFIKKRDVVGILRVAKCAIVENKHVESFVRRYIGNIYTIIGPIDIEKNYPRQYFFDKSSEKIIIGWIGSPSTAVYLETIAGVLRELRKNYTFKIVLIGIDGLKIDGIEMECVNWRENTEISELHRFDIGIMPMPDNEWTRGKVGCKMLQYMANAIPAVVSYTPTNAEIIIDGKNGFLCKSDIEWFEKLSRLINDKNLREKVGREGRRTIEERFSLKVNALKLLGIIRNVINE